MKLSGCAGSLPEDSSCACAAQVLKLHFAVPTAIMFLRRYYSVKAVQENDRFIVVCACVFLAAKCEEEPRNLNDVCYQIFKFRYAVEAAADFRWPSFKQLADLQEGSVRAWLLAPSRCILQISLLKIWKDSVFMHGCCSHALGYSRWGRLEQFGIAAVETSGWVSSAGIATMLRRSKT